MKITSRGQLIELINKIGVETFPVEVTEDKKILNTIIHQRKNNEYYRVVWGEVKEIKNGKDVIHLWYDDEVNKVKLDENTGYWMTKGEKKESENKMIGNAGANINEISLYSVEDGLIFINGVNHELKEEDGFNNVKLVAGATGSGKSQYVYVKIAKAIKNNKSVLLFSTDEGPQGVIRRLVRIMAPNAYDKTERKEVLTDEERVELSAVLELLSNSKLRIESNHLMDDNFILDTMEEVAESPDGLDLVIIDFLKLGMSDNSHKAIINIHKKMDVFRQKLGCKVIITTQTSRNYNN